MPVCVPIYALLPGWTRLCVCVRVCVCVVCSLQGEEQWGMGRAVGSGVREAISHSQALTQQFPFSGSSSGLGGAILRVSPSE